MLLICALLELSDSKKPEAPVPLNMSADAERGA
jgi:hypothetical protein